MPTSPQEMDGNNMAIDTAHTKWWQTFEVVFGVPFLIAIFLQLFFPFSFPRGFFTPALIVAGAIVLFIGVILAFLARREFAKYNQPTDPGHPTLKIINTGVFSFSRNPLYLGGICIIVGVALIVNLPWVLILLLPALLVCHFVLIFPEERYLTAKFSNEYRLYTHSVHRWIGRSKSPPTK